MYTAIIPDAKAQTLIPIIREKVTPDSIVYTDSFQVYDVLDVSEFHHKRINHSKTFVSKGTCDASTASRKTAFTGS